MKKAVLLLILFAITFSTYGNEYANKQHAEMSKYVESVKFFSTKGEVVERKQPKYKELTSIEKTFPELEEANTFDEKYQIIKERAKKLSSIYQIKYATLSNGRKNAVNFHVPNTKGKEINTDFYNYFEIPNDEYFRYINVAPLYTPSGTHIDLRDEAGYEIIDIEYETMVNQPQKESTGIVKLTDGRIFLI